MAKSSVARRISPMLDAKIRMKQAKAEKFMGIKISYVQASAMLAKEV